jgi:gas vesicle protein
MSAGKFFMGVLVGAAAGALLGVLFAPGKGSETRQKISKKGEEYIDEMKEKFEEFLQHISKESEKTADEAGTTAEAK